jgi:2-polyprenyl-3-methyl-5-hydroxy-6-metoxy-1,4-benzoquinol methylase
MCTESDRMDAYYLTAGPRAFQPDSPRLLLMASLCVGPRVLDVGCGAGDLLLMLQAEHPAWSLAGTDISRVALGACIGRGVKAALHVTGEVPPGPWSTVVMGQVLEHVADDRAMVDAATRGLVPGGRLVASVPKEGEVLSADHKRQYTVKQFRALLRRVGRVRQAHWPGEETRVVLWAEKAGNLEDS